MSPVPPGPARLRGRRTTAPTARALSDPVLAVAEEGRERKRAVSEDAEAELKVHSGLRVLPTSAQLLPDCAVAAAEAGLLQKVRFALQLVHIQPKLLSLVHPV